MIPNPIDSLTVIAEISLGLVGLTAIVTVLRQPDGSLGRLDRIRSVFLLVYSGVTLLLALLPSLLTAMDCAPELTWRISSGAMLLFALAGYATDPAPRLRYSLSSPRSLYLIFIYSAAFLNAILQLANCIGVFGLPRFWPYFLGLLWFLTFCLTLFAALLFMRPSE